MKTKKITFINSTPEFQFTESIKTGDRLSWCTKLFLYPHNGGAKSKGTSIAQACLRDPPHSAGTGEASRNRPQGERDTQHVTDQLYHTNLFDSLQ